ncbi:MAG: hypothetical protein K2X99_06755 [Gemmatimonadaceae bacterium]|nr:hypothetical protein [Gemmatimonadaceae bacterium]
MRRPCASSIAFVVAALCAAAPSARAQATIAARTSDAPAAAPPSLPRLMVLCRDSLFQLRLDPERGPWVRVQTRPSLDGTIVYQDLDGANRAEAHMDAARIAELWAAVAAAQQRAEEGVIGLHERRASCAEFDRLRADLGSSEGRQRIREALDSGTLVSVRREEPDGSKRR